MQLDLRHQPLGMAESGPADVNKQQQEGAFPRHAAGPPFCPGGCISSSICHSQAAGRIQPHHACMARCRSLCMAAGSMTPDAKLLCEATQQCCTCPNSRWNHKVFCILRECYTCPSLRSMFKMLQYCTQCKPSASSWGICDLCVEY